MTDMNLELKREDEICLPVWIGSSHLTLAEIGAVVCIACAQKGNEAALRLEDPPMIEAVHQLRDGGLLKAELNGNQLSINLDLEPARPE